MSAINRLWAPWRIKYVQAIPTRGCIFCVKQRQKQDKKNYILSRNQHVFSLLNLYPYNNGHILVAPYRHVADLTALTTAERAELMETSAELMKILKTKLKPQGFNFGANIGAAAGAGIAHHVHLHIVPRWTGDVNFMPVVAETKIISQSLEELYGILTT